MTSIKKIPKENIENFEKHYKQNVLQPKTSLNGYGHFVSCIYSFDGTRKGIEGLPEENICKESGYNKKRVIKIIEEKCTYYTSRYGMVFLEIPNNKQFRYDYVFYDENGTKQISSYAKINYNNCTNESDYTFGNTDSCFLE